MPPLNPPHLHFNKLKIKRTTRAAAAAGGGAAAAAAVAKKGGLVGILCKLRDAHHRAAPPASSSPHCHGGRHGLCYPPAPSSWPWPSCRHPRTSSFRWPSPAAPQEEDDAVYRTANAVYDTSSERRRSSSMDEAAAAPEAPEEEEKELRLRETAVVRGVRSDRLFFDPAAAEFLPKNEPPPPTTTTTPPTTTTTPPADADDKATAMNMEIDNASTTITTSPADGKNESAAAAVMKGGATVLTVESEDPYGDFRSSMAEMVAAHGLRDWEGLEELLAWYLKLNAKGAHGVIVGAFIDMLVGLASSSSLISQPSLPSPSPSSSCITFEDYSSATMEEESCRS
uniref:Transcription repressor n=1 Tax=Leersia perrieri TaxID=77586 RepID=A0A0D9W4R7_9ORYZ